MEHSLLEKERLTRGWSRLKMEIKFGIPRATLTRHELGHTWPNQDDIERYCRVYGKSVKELGLDKSDRIGVGNANAPTSQEENPIMSDLIRRQLFSNLSSKLTGLIDLWPKHNYHYEELQSGISQAIIDYNGIVAHDSTCEYTRRQALKDMALVPVQLVGGIAVVNTTHIQKTDTDILLKRCAAGITACWYLRRGKDLTFVSDLASTYVSLLQPLVYSRSETHRKAAATLLAQNFRLKSKLADALRYDNQAIAYEEEAIRYALMADNVIEQAIANREMAALYWEREEYEQALPYAEKAYALTAKDTPKIIRSFTASGLALCQSTTGQDAEASLTKALDLFDPTASISSIPYGESILTAVTAATKQHSGAWFEAVQLYEKSLTVPDISALGGVSQRINYTKTEVSRDDKPRDMALCITLLTESITGARELDSKLFIRKAHECYTLLRIAWPREDAIQKLGKDHFGK